MTRGEVYLMLKRYNAALADFNRAIELEPNNDWCLYVRALAYQTLKQPKKARSDFAGAVKFAKERYKENFQDWHNTFNLALYYLAVDYAPTAEQLYRYALSQSASLQHIQEAIRDLDDFLTIFPNHIQALSLRQLLQSALTQ